MSIDMMSYAQSGQYNTIVEVCCPLHIHVLKQSCTISVLVDAFC